VLNLGVALQQSCAVQSNGSSRSDMAIAVLRRAVVLCSSGDCAHPLALKGLGGALLSLFKQLGYFELLVDSIRVLRVALILCRLESFDRCLAMCALADALRLYFETQGDNDTLAEAVDLYRQALNLCPNVPDYRSCVLDCLANSFQIQYKQLNDLDLLTKAVNMHRQALDLRPPGHSERVYSLNRLATALYTRFQHLGDYDSLTEAIDWYQQALDLRPPGHPDRSITLGNLASALHTRVRQLGDLNSLAEAIALNRQAFDLRPPGHPDRCASLENLASALMTQFEQLGNLNSLAEAVDLDRQALYLCPPGHPERSSKLNRLGGALITQFQQLGNLTLLAEAIDVCRQGLEMRPPGHPHRVSSLNSLACALRTRFEELGDCASMAEAIDLHRQALDLTPPGHPHRSMSLSNLAEALHFRFERLGGLALLFEAVILHRQAPDLRPPGHPDHSSSLNNLGIALQTRYPGDLDSLQEVVDLHRQALDLTPLADSTRSTHQSSLANLATAIAAGGSSPPHVSDWEEKLDLAKEGLRTCPDESPVRMTFLFSFAECMLQTETPFFNFVEGIHHILKGLRHRASPTGQQLDTAIRIMPIVEAAYQFMSKDTGRPDHDDMVLHLYILVIRLLPRVASFGHDHRGRLLQLLTAEELSRNAAARAILMKREEEAIEMLEEGRDVFWAQALRLRGTELDLLPPEDAQELRELFQILEAENNHHRTLSSAQQERLAEQRRLHGEVAEALISDIRTRPGMERFLMPPAFVSLVQSLPLGFIIFLNVSELGHHALIIDGRTRSVSSPALKLPTRIVSTKRKPVQPKLPRDSASADVKVLEDDVSSIFRQHDGPRASGVRKRAIRTFEDGLGDLWMFIVKPIIDVLQLKVSLPLVCA
jgi:tetratricopeptide (TPR) repeat protein